MSGRLYVRLKVWNFDASPRVEYHEEMVKTEKQGVRLVQRIRNMFGALPSTVNVGRNWLSRRGVDGHILEVIGLYRRTEEKLM